MNCITLVCNPTDTPNQMGALERHVALLKLAVARIRAHDESLPFAESVRSACLDRNNSLILGSGSTPSSSIVFGKSDYFYPLDSGHVQSSEVMSPEEARVQKHITAVASAKAEIMKIDARQTANTCLQRNLRPGGKVVPLVGSAVDILAQNRWISGRRVVGMVSSNVICELDGQFKKVPFACVRPTEEALIPPENNANSDTETSSRPGLIRYAKECPDNRVQSEMDKDREELINV